MKNLFLALFLGGAFFACVGDIGNTLKTDHVARMLHADTFKIWTKTFRSVNGSEEDFSQSNALIFLNSSSAEVDSMLVGTISTDGQIISIVDSLNFQPAGDIDNNFIDMLFLIRGDSVTDSIFVEDITTQYLRITMDDGTVEEIFEIDPEME